LSDKPYKRIKDSLELPPLLSVAMDDASIYTIQVSADEGLHPHTYHHLPFSTISLSPTLVDPTQVNNAHYTERPSRKLRFTSGASNILNSLAVNAAGQSLYSISSNSKHTTLVSCLDNVEIASIQWDRSSPRMVFRHKKWKCRYWLPRTAPENEYVFPSPLTNTVVPFRIKSEYDTARSRTLTHGDSQFTWTHGSSSGRVCICPAKMLGLELIELSQLSSANQPGLAVARWHIMRHTDELILDVFQETPVDSGLLEAIVLSVVLLRSGRSLGDSPENVNISSPRYGSPFANRLSRI
jgi:hypothetical protein